MALVATERKLHGTKVLSVDFSLLGTKVLENEKSVIQFNYSHLQHFLLLLLVSHTTSKASISS